MKSKYGFNYNYEKLMNIEDNNTHIFLPQGKRKFEKRDFLL